MNNQDEVKSRVQKTFGKNALKYVKSESHAKGDDLALLVEWLAPKANWVVLDIATGGGHVAKALSHHCRQVFATDLTKEMLAAAAEHLTQKCCSNVSYVVADAESLPFLNNTFDAVTCRIAAHHFSSPKEFVKEAARVLKPNGFLLLIDNVVPEDTKLAVYMNTVEQLRDHSHVRCLPISEWRLLLRDCGLCEVTDQQQKKTFSFPTWVERTASDAEQIALVEKFVLQASPEAYEFFFHQTGRGEGCLFSS